MPRFDLRKNKTAFDPLAPFKVLAVMCHPNERVPRERMLALVQSQTGAGHARRRRMLSNEFYADVKLHSARAGVASGLLLTMLQLHNEGLTPSLNKALPLAVAALPEWDNFSAAYWSQDSHIGHQPHSRRKVLAAYSTYLPVVHLWGAMIHGLQQEREDIWPGSLQTLPTFLAYANVILDQGSALPSPDSRRRFALTHSGAWNFTIPETIVGKPRLHIAPLNDWQRRILNERISSNPLF